MIELSYDSKDAIPAEYASLYTEKDGKFALTGVTGMKTQADVDNVQKALKSERALKKELESKIGAYDGIGSDGLRASLDELARLRTTGGKVDDSKIEDIVAERLKLDKEKHQRDLEGIQGKYDTLEAKNNDLVNGINKGKIESGLREAAGGLVNEGAMSDVVYRSSMFEVSEDGAVVTREGAGVTPGLEPKQWLEKELETKPHWQKTSKGAGANGSKSVAGSSANGSNSIAQEVESQVTFND